MYRQILINPDQRRLQCILWRSDPSQLLATYQLNTVTYGTSSASFLAIRCMHQLALENQGDMQEASEIIMKDFYVDDLLSGAESPTQAIILAQQISDILGKGCFPLRKWVSNSSELLSSLENSDDSLKIRPLNFGECSKTLGIHWNPTNDVLQYEIPKLELPKLVSKRIILSTLSQVFDPLGLLGPVIVSGKMLIQQLRLEKLSWDESVSDDIKLEWLQFVSELPKLNSFQIPRYASHPEKVSTTLHGFADASNKAYGACIYLCCMDTQGNTKITLLCAKSRVAPLKPLTIPRLELCAALILARLLKITLRAFGLNNINDCFLWTDSMIVLCWLKSKPSYLKQFVGNRISEIQALTHNFKWGHVRTNHNPADLISRGVSATALINSNLWWKGPPWLKLDPNEWPSESKINVPNELPELRAIVSLANINFDQENALLLKFSSFSRLQRVLSYAQRFLSNCKGSRQNRQIGPLSTTELNNATSHLIKLHQKVCYQRDLLSLKRGEAVHQSSKLSRLHPFIDDLGLIRVGGRLKEADLPFYKKHPIVLDSKHEFAKLFFVHYHKRYLHAGPLLMLSNIREAYWPVRSREVIRKIRHDCITCFKVKPSPIGQFMGNLPKQRLSPTLPFSVCGIDYAGPFQIKDKRGRGGKIAKAYACLIVCFSTRAVHIELVLNLTTDCFLSALRRFISRRGLPLEIFSDNGTTFKGANNEMREMGDFLKNNNLNFLTEMSKFSIKWHFIPPQAPNFGGLWEAGVRSMKFHLKRIVGNCSLVYEDLNSILVQIEGVLNSRPISPMSDDPADLNPLTPSHFLLGRHQNMMPEADMSDVPINRLDNYQHLQKLRQDFWYRWSRDYLCELQQRKKWNKQRTQLQEGEMVLIKEENQPPLLWKVGRVIQVYKGQDDLVRVADIMTSTGVLKRSVSKICQFPISDCD